MRRSSASRLSRATFSGRTPCFSRLSPVTRSFWIRSRACSSIPTTLCIESTFRSMVVARSPSWLRVLIADDHRLFAEALRGDSRTARSASTSSASPRNGREAVDARAGARARRGADGSQHAGDRRCRGDARDPPRPHRTLDAHAHGLERTERRRSRPRGGRGRLRDEGQDRGRVDSGDPRRRAVRRRATLPPCSRFSPSSTSSSRSPSSG